jgi:hypothetical protein
MSRDYFAILGLTPGRHDPAEITRRFRAARERLLAALDDPATHSASRKQLDELHLAYAALRDPQRQTEYLASRRKSDVMRVRWLITASLEDGLLRHSRRLSILEEARKFGFSDFQTQLLIAQVQFGDNGISLVGERASSGGSKRRSRMSPRIAAASILALALFLALVRWLGA